MCLRIPKNWFLNELLLQEYLSGDSSAERMNILKKRADWAQDIHDPRAAAEMYLNAGETLKAVEIIAANGWTSMQVPK